MTFCQVRIAQNNYLFLEGRIAMAASGKQVSQRISIAASVGSVESLIKAMSALTSVGASFQVGLHGNVSRVVSVMHKLKGMGLASAALSLRGSSEIK